MTTRLMVATLVLLCGASIYAADNWPGDGGKSDSVKDWRTQDYQTAVSAGKPIAVYIFDPEYKNNGRAKFVEGSQAIANIDVRDVLKQSFTCIRIKSDGTDVRGWPKDLLQHAVRSASLVLMSNDGKQIYPFDKRMANEQINPAVVLKAAQSIVQYEEKLKRYRETADKLSGGAKKEAPKEAAAAEPVSNKIPGLPPKEETLPGPKPKEEKKTTPPPAAARKTPQPTDE